MQLLEEGTRGQVTSDRDELVELLVQRLRADGAPQGMWLVDIAKVREALQAADQLLRRMSDAIVREMTD